MSTTMAFAMYKPHAGKENALAALVKKHLPALRQYGLITERDGYLAKSKDGTFCEIFEWVSPDASRQAHEHPAIAKIWEAMGEIADFPAMNALPEAGNRFPNFAMMAL